MYIFLLIFGNIPIDHLDWIPTITAGAFPLFILIHFKIKNNYHNKLKNNVSRKFLKWFFLWYCSLIQ